MSVVPMKKLTLLGMKSDEDAILSCFAKLGCVHLDEMEVGEHNFRVPSTEKKAELEGKMQLIEKALGIIKEETMAFIKDKDEEHDRAEDTEKMREIKSGWKPIELSFEDFSDAERDEFKLFGGVIDKVIGIKDRMESLKDEILKNTALINQLDVYSSVDVPFSEIADTEHVSLILGTVQMLNKTEVEKLQEKFSRAEIVVFETAKDKSVVFAACLKEEMTELLEALNRYSFVKCTFGYGMNAGAKCKELRETNEQMQGEIRQLKKEIYELTSYIPQLKVLYDFYLFTLQKAGANDELTVTSETFQAKAWIPEYEEKRVSEALDALTPFLYYYTEKPVREELPPTLIKTDAFVTPYQMITNMYSVTNYWERDNNRWVAIFYFLFFGFMLGDVGYGFLLALGSFLMIRILKPKKGTEQLLKILMWGGVSTMFWGVIFGGWFSIQEGVPEAIISPLTDPLTMMVLSIGLGIVHVTVGLILGGIGEIKNGSVVNAVCDKFSWAAFFIGAMMYAGGSIEASLSFLGMPGLVLIGAGLLTVLFTAGRNKKGIGKIIGGLGGLYGIINYLSDILSYLRLFGLGLATGIIGMVFNQLGGLLLGGAGFLIGVLVLVAGHSLNLAINVLGTFVHDMRLQHIEFFSKFFVGEGIAFTPFAGETRYISIVKKKEDKVVKV